MNEKIEEARSVYPENLYLSICTSRKGSTVKLVYNDYSRDPPKKAVVDRWVVVVQRPLMIQKLLTGPQNGGRCWLFRGGR